MNDAFPLPERTREYAQAALADALQVVIARRSSEEWELSAANLVLMVRSWLETGIDPAEAVVQVAMSGATAFDTMAAVLAEDPLQLMEAVEFPIWE
ncbi:hypothetical protein [Herbiconiux sp. VKM Ac-2851]|uniref:hypothetical protein n=1 Tax=Herbiconiux sp. VKM Ac-2851 TaxID=2739025 RepID=UPI001563FB3F|nr:hypothetical protein [Herbiconiux sp. VKM Ac-2851]NQX35548.1 hypothetical protein [Herbiconiux sp. VKM Ac-2851]